MQLIFNTTHGFFLQAGAEQAHELRVACTGFGCSAEEIHQVALVAVVLILAISSIVCAFFLFREDKEEQITPLCPELVATKEIAFKLVLPEDPAAPPPPPPPTVVEGDAAVAGATGDSGSGATCEPAAHGDGGEAARGPQPFTTEIEGLNHRCRVVIECVSPPDDPFRAGVSSSVRATVRLVSDRDLLATLVVRNVATQGQCLTLCRGGSDIFGSVELDPATKRYHVKHRTGVHMMTLAGDFNCMGFFNPARVDVGRIGLSDGCCEGSVKQQIDAGLMVASFVGAYVHKQLSMHPPPPPPRHTLPSEDAQARAHAPSDMVPVQGGSLVPPRGNFRPEADSPARPHSAPVGGASERSPVTETEEEEWQA